MRFALAIDCHPLRREYTDHLQVVTYGQCALGDHRTLKPQQDRVYEYPSSSGSESANVARFLVSIEDPSPEVFAAIESVVTWFEEAKLISIRVDRIADESVSKGYDLDVVKDE